MRTSDYHLEIEPGRGGPYDLDLSEFALGGNESTVRKVTTWGGDYSGRPDMALELADFFDTLAPIRTTCDSIRSSMRQFYRFLDLQAPDVSRSGDVTDAMGPAFLNWLVSIGSNYDAYKKARMAVNGMRALSGGKQLFWPSRRPDISVRNDPLDDRALRALFHALRHEARDVKRMLFDGKKLADAGCDPRRSERPDPFSVIENRAWLARELMRDGLPDRASAIAAGARDLLVGAGPSYIAPTMSDRSSRGLTGALRWFVPARSDTAIFLALFLLSTGWNLATATAVDVSSREEWFQPHPQVDRFAVIHAYKNRAERHQFAISMTRPEWHPYRLIEFMIETTAPLRRQVLRELAAMRKAHAATPSIALAGEIHRHERLARSPWLFASVTTGKVSGFHEEMEATHVGAVVRDVVVRRGLAEAHPRLLEFRTSDVRDSWIGYAYVQSGYNVLLTRLASQHASSRTLKHYLGFRRFRAHSEGQIRKLQHALFSEIEARRPIDPTRLRLLVANGEITSDQEARLLDLRQRTRLGAGCLDPRSPDKSVAPDHPQGALCRVQRCVGCSKGIVFEESLPALASALAELRHIRRSIPVPAWEGSSFDDEYQALEQTLLGFDQIKVLAQLASWEDKLLSGEIQPHATYPNY
ncbi:hypothetical protein [Tardiphaga sp. 841_E9_N1_2]|uniref:hypothetical protein n=1 Tax=Tardiphaga sp. 841_E9_N1_2 TaxID=3240762 RepID=UPI003F26E662